MTAPSSFLLQVRTSLLVASHPAPTQEMILPPPPSFNDLPPPPSFRNVDDTRISIEGIETSASTVDAQRSLSGVETEVSTVDGLSILPPPDGYGTPA